MTDESKGFDPYESVLSDLRAKRDQIDQAIQLLEGLRSGLSIPSLTAGAGMGQATPDHGPGAFLGMTIPDATKKLLAMRKRAMNNADIVAALKGGGLAMRSVDPINTVGSVLTRRFNTVGDIVRVARGTWGLAEWYPNRSFRKKGAPVKGDAGDGAEESASPTTSERELLS